MVFENRFHTTREMYKEYVGKVLCRRIYVLGSIFSVIAALAFILSIRGNQTMAAVEGVCLFILLAVMIITPGKVLKQLLETDKQLHNGEHPECVVTFGDHISLTEGKQTLAIEYAQIINIYRLKTCSVLMFTKQNGILYLEDHFTVGNSTDFNGFILEKCVNVSRIEQR